MDILLIIGFLFAWAIVSFILFWWGMVLITIGNDANSGLVILLGVVVLITPVIIWVYFALWFSIRLGVF